MFDKCSANSSGIVVPSSAINSDLSASTSVIKSKTKKMLLDEVMSWIGHVQVSRQGMSVGPYADYKYSAGLADCLYRVISITPQ